MFIYATQYTPFRRAVITGVSQMMGQIQLQNAQALGTDIVEVTAHAGARPTHAVWQGLWYSLTGDTTEYPNLARITGYGSVAGLKGANCRHDFYPVIPGISEPTYTKEQLANIDPPPQTVKINGKDVKMSYYDLTQQQRAYERSIRARRRDVAAASGIVDGCVKGTPEYDAAYREFQAASLKLRTMRTAYTDFSKSVGLLTRNERTQAYSFDRSISAKAVWAVRNYQKELDKYTQVRYNDDGTVIVTDNMTDKVHYSAPPHFKPNAVLDVRAGHGDNSQINRTYYNENGGYLKRIDSSHHGNPKQHPFEPHGAHRHDRIQTPKGEDWSKGQPLNFTDLTENKDIL